MESLWVYLPAIMALACPISMGLMMWYMNRSHGQPSNGMPMPPSQPTTNKEVEVSTLREQLNALQAQISALETPTQTTKK